MSINVPIKVKNLEVGQELTSLTKPPITKVQLVKYAGASGDFNPLHTDDEFAQKIGMDGVIAHGMLIMGFLGQYVMEVAGDMATVKKFRMRFGAMSRPGDEITCSGVIDKIYEKDGKGFVDLELHATRNKDKIVGTGKATLQFHKKEWKEVGALYG
ncbi:MaoC/PaaZ C-terminal domain-containing protein [Virgibacillus sp. MSP4-1]|uniref:MaoC/PaaZ C-terminal domain-containing protein n=1 Tax=Virgibacillus sp. MSP4-1 TaxID=2700081 RepID=UPI00039AC868